MTYNFNANCLKFSTVVLFLLFFQFTKAQSGLNGLDEIIHQKQKVLGEDVVLMVAKKDTVIYEKANKIFTPKTPAPIGNSSQWLTAALVMVMVDEGKLSLDDKVSQYIPVFSSYMKSYITLRHCLSNFTGIQYDQPKMMKLFEKKKFESLEEEVNEIAKKHIQANAGEEFRYNDFGFEIAARVLEIVSKKKFDLLAQQKLFRPLGMRQTSFSSWNGGAVDASSGARSSANDYIHFLTMLLNKGVYKGQRILSEESVAALRKIQTNPQLIKYTPDATKGFAYALGAWAPEENDTNEATVLTAPSFGGTLPIVDFCRGYAALVLVKNLTDDAKAFVYPEIKEELDGKFRSQCK